MPRHMSVAETERAVIARWKTATRRLGWWTDKNGKRLLHPGDHLLLVRKSMGRKRPDGTVEPLVVLAEVEVTDVYRERLAMISDEHVYREGVPFHKWEPFSDGGTLAYRVAWARWYAHTFRCEMSDDVTVIEWRYLDGAS